MPLDTPTFIQKIEECVTQEELDIFHQKNAMLVEDNPELLTLIFNQRCKIIEKQYK